MKKRMYLEIDSISENENFARVTVASFVSRLNPTLEEIADIKTAVSEAVTNAIVHGYDGKDGIVYITCEIEENEVHITIEDKGIGIENVDKAREPLYTTKPDDERSGMGFVFMEVFMDSLTVESKISEGTIIRMSKKIGE